MFNRWIRTLIVLVITLSFSLQASSKIEELPVDLTSVEAQNMLDELDPFDPNIEKILEEYDQVYEEETGLDSHIDDENSFFGIFKSLKKKKNVETCVRQQCPVWVQVVKSTQTFYLYENGALTATWKTSTGTPGRGTPNMDMHPNGRIYDKYTSTKFPGGNYKGLGNMPFAVFITGGFAIHGTAESNWKFLGRRASHGCIRLHPDNALYFNRLVRKAGVQWVWITVQE